MRFLLINPFCPIAEGPTPPLGVAFLAAALESADMDVKVLDFAVTPYSQKRLEDVMLSFQPDIVGCTSVTMTFPDAIQIIGDAKQISKEVLTVMGGPHVSFCAERTFQQYPELDLIVIGEGEETIVELARKAKGDRDWSQVRGIAYRENEKTCFTPNRPLLDVNSLPAPARHLLPLGRYRALNTAISMTTSRGCPCRCIFCVGRKMVGAKVRYRLPELVVDELAYLSTLGFPQINIADDLFTARKNHCIAICDEILNRDLKVKWTSFARVDTVSPEVLQKMRAAGCTTISFGVESANAEILKRVKKGITPEKVVNAIRMCVDAGIDPHASFILGLPGETPQTLRETQDFGTIIHENGGSYGFHLLAPFPGTAIYDHNEQYDLKILTEDWRQYHANRAIVETEAVNKEMLNQIAENWDSDLIQKWDGMRKRLEEGSASEEDQWHIFNLNRFGFLYDLMMNSTLEEKGHWVNGVNPLDSDKGLEELADKIFHYTNRTKDEALDLLKDLFQRDGIRFSQENGEVRWEWNDFIL